MRERLSDAGLMIGMYVVILAGVAFSAAPIFV